MSDSISIANVPGYPVFPSHAEGRQSNRRQTPKREPGEAKKAEENSLPSEGDEFKTARSNTDYVGTQIDLEA